MTMNTSLIATEAPEQNGNSLVAKFAKRYTVDPGKLLATLKATCFKLSDSSKQVTNEQMVALLVVADQYGLNPFTKEIFAFEDKHKGVVPVVSVDGWARMINDHPMMDGIEFRFAEEEVTPVGGKKCPIWCEAVIYRKDRSRPTIVREFLDEVYVPPRGQNQYAGPWQSHTKRMLRHKAEIQCARIAFSFSGVYDEDEAYRVIDAVATRVPGRTVTDASNASSLQKKLEDASASSKGVQPETIVGEEAAGDATDSSASET